ncbi:uncharacterized protein J4E88_000918 [Alternaria novae-zelandiae]|uniref:uncharacterized protein n=1 Tax=Alternaria novae-zelandiae TaxID=430562 RepID=UPI0020C4F12A|nr:uncharacterized protein J4E88_000918 [Alternaria novae-zelandiae]KAI4696740.1 hypothetical protein J4E88_000918 [Alternaria novae-zelandiae]
MARQAVEKTTPEEPLDEQLIQPQLTPSADLEGQAAPAEEQDVFGNEEGAEIQYKTCKWCQVMLAENVSLGVLALPQALAILGLVPGLLCICFLGIIATYTGYLIGEFKLAHPSVANYADCGMLMSGPVLREVLAVGQLLVLIFIMGAHILTFAVAMNAMTDHGTCTIVFTVVGLIISFLLGLPRTFKNISYFSYFSCASIIVAVTVTMIAISIQKPDMGNIVAVRPDVPLVKGLAPVMNIVLAYTGHVAFFSFQSELEDPRDFRKALIFEQGIAVTFYMLISVIIYYYAGPLVASPALGSASPLVSKICFGIALPTIIVAGVVNGSVATKYIYFRKNGRLFSSTSQTAFTILNISIVILGMLIFGLGMWSSGWALNRGSGGKVFSCDNNWHPVSWVSGGAKDA